MWLVVVECTYYPEVTEFEKEKDAVKWYIEQKKFYSDEYIRPDFKCIYITNVQDYYKRDN